MSGKIHPFAMQGQYTEVPNFVFDYLMPRIAASSLQVLLLILRRTRGWHKSTDAISYSQIKEGTGIASDATVSKALQELLAAEIILKRAGKTAREPAQYALNREYEIEADVAFNTQKSTSNNEERKPPRPSKNEAKRALQKMKDEKKSPSKNEDTKEMSTHSTEQSLSNSNSYSKNRLLSYSGERECAREKNSPDSNGNHAPPNGTLAHAPTPPDRKKKQNGSVSTQRPTSTQRAPFDLSNADDPRFHTPHYRLLLELCDEDDELLKIDPRKRALAAGYAVMLEERYSLDQMRQARAHWPHPTSPTPKQFCTDIPRLLNRREVNHEHTKPRHERLAEDREKWLAELSEEMAYAG